LHFFGINTMGMKIDAKWWHLHLVVPLLFCGLALADSPTKVPPIVEQVCAACHGLDGNSVDPIVPKISAHSPDYLLLELRNFRSGERKSEIMGAIAPTVSEADLKAIAAYFGAQKSTSDTMTDPVAAALGQKIFMDGDEERGVPACAGCHEEDGSGSKRFPRLAGQHKQYLVGQLQKFKNDVHTHPGTRLMRVLTKRLTDAELEAVAEYISAK
jgi:cytochrome c553